MEALECTVNTAENAMNNTKNLLAKKGRSSKLGNRSIGHIDPGAASSFAIINSIFQTLKEMN
jgi:dihydroxyacetone kinase-like protein